MHVGAHCVQSMISQWKSDLRLALLMIADDADDDNDDNYGDVNDGHNDAENIADNNNDDNRLTQHCPPASACAWQAG